MTNYVEKAFDEIFKLMIEDSIQKGLISHVDDFLAHIENLEDISNYYVMDKAVIASMFVEVYQDITKVYESAKVEYAEGDDLDSLGELLGISRPDATYSEVIVTFTVTEVNENDIQIPAGVIISTESGIEYETLEEIYISTEELFTIVSARSLTPGVSGRVVENTLINIVDNLDVNLEVNNPVASSGGQEAYTDDEYRYLLMNWTKINVKGSLEAYENYFSDFNGIDSYKIVPNWNGTGTIKCILDPGTDYQLNTAYQDLQNIVTQAPEDITMFAPEKKPIDVSAIVNVDIDQINPYSTVEKNIIQSKIISSIKLFINGGYKVDGSWYEGLLLGEDFIPHKLAVFLDEEIPELKNINFNYPSNFVEIADDEIGVSNEINIEMI